jgi:peptidoglycan/xylan/chitin deacetylase (PgdA/CDA1 family)
MWPAIIILLCTSITPIYFVYKPPGWLISVFEQWWPQVLWRVKTSQKIIALTIDDSPSEYTSEILDILNTHGAYATFFVIGSQALGKEDFLKTVVGSGHELANHAMYDEPSRALGTEALEGQIRHVQFMIESVYTSSQVHPPPHYFRPGSGFFSSRMLGMLDRCGYRLVLGNIYPHDPQISHWRINASHILSMLKPGGIIICHDRRSWTPPMLRAVLPEIQSRGYEVVTITELLRRTTTESRVESNDPSLRRRG